MKWLSLILFKFFSIKFYSQNELGIDLLDKEDMWSNDDFYIKEVGSSDIKSFWEYFFNLGLVNSESKFFIKIRQIYYFIFLLFSDILMLVFINLMNITKNE